MIARYSVTSPNQRELEGRIVTPNTIDERIVEQANAVRNRIQQAQPDEVDVAPQFAEFEPLLDPFKDAKLLAELPAGVSIYPRVPLVDVAEGPVGAHVKLVDVFPLPKPLVSFGRTTFLSEDEDGDPTGFTYEPVNWVTVSSVFDVKRQSEAQRREYGPLRKKVIYGVFEAQRRARRPDGSWSDDDWENIDSYPTPDLPPIPDIQLVEDGGKIIVPQDSYQQVDRFASALDDVKTQLDLLRPMFPAVDYGDCPRFPVITTARDVFFQDDEYLFPDEEPSEDPEVRYACWQEEAKEPEPEKQLTAADAIRRDFQRAEELLVNAWKYKSEDDAVKANNIAVEIRQNANADEFHEKAQKLQRRADQRYKDIIRWKKHNQGTVAATGEDEGQKKREPLPRQQIWVHDARRGSVRGNHTYEYRLRPWIYNRLAGLPRDFEHKQDATVLLIPGPWSEPSDPVTIEPESQFFVTSFKEKDELVNVEFYRWFEGVWVSTRARFGVGQTLAREDRAKVPDREDPDGFDNAEVRFATDAIVGDIDFHRSYRLPKRSGRGIRLSPPSTVCSVVLVDSSGRLDERIVPLDKAHPGNKILAERVWKAPRPKKKGKGP